MKRFLLSLILGTALSTTLLAQSTDSTNTDQNQPQTMGTPTQRVDRQLNTLTKKLNLTPDQVTQLRPILLNQAMTMDSLRTHPSGNRRSDMTGRREVLQDTDSKIEALLTDDQKKLYQEWKEEQRKTMQRRRGGRFTRQS
ncbi:MAG: hypothetical protein JST68_05970 [Bacteroidetes bacterium]|nr:hypothetical protein [Bacteroidota bacterium]